MQKVQIAGEEYPVLFDINVLAKVQERYGSVDVFPKKLREIKETVWILTQIINEAASYQRVFEGAAAVQESMTEERLGMLLTFDDLLRGSSMAKVIIDSFNEGMSGRKNRQAGQGKKSRSGKRKKKRR